VCFSNKDLEVWSIDPIEFVRREWDLFGDIWDPRPAGITVLSDLLMFRKGDYLHVVAQMCMSVLTKYNTVKASIQNSNDPNASKLLLEVSSDKEGAMYILGCINRFLGSEQDISKTLEAFLTTHVITELDNQNLPFMRARAAWTIGEFYKVEWQNIDMFTQVLERMVVMTYSDPDFVVRLRSALALRYLVTQRNGHAKKILSPKLPQLLEVYLKILQDIESEEMFKALEGIIVAFDNEIAPFALTLVSKVVERFKELTDEDEDNDQAGMAASEAVSSIQIICHAVFRSPDVLFSLQSVLVPIFASDLLLAHCMEHFDESLELLAVLTCYTPGETSPQLWSLFPLLYAAGMTWGHTFIVNIVICLDNYIDRGKNTFLTGSAPVSLDDSPDAPPPVTITYLEMVFNLFKRVVADLQIDEMDVAEGCKLINAYIQHCTGHPSVDQLLPHIIQIVMTRLGTTENGITIESVYALLVQVILNALLANTKLTLQVLLSLTGVPQPDKMPGAANFNGVTYFVFELWRWLNDKRGFPNERDKKLAILALATIIRTPFEELPPVLQSAFPNILRQIIKTQDALASQRALSRGVNMITKEQRDVTDGDGDEDGEDGEENEDEDEEDSDDGRDVNKFYKVSDDEDIAGMVSEGVGEMVELKESVKQFWDKSSEGYEFMDPVADEDDYVETPFDAVDEIEVVVKSLQVIGTTNQALWTELMKAMTDDEKKFMEQMVTYVNEKAIPQPQPLGHQLG